jgi:hypothetical protein
MDFIRLAGRKIYPFVNTDSLSTFLGQDEKAARNLNLVFLLSLAMAPVKAGLYDVRITIE